jgi:hypothetical protein
MMLSLYVTLGILLFIAVRNPSANRSLIAFAAWSSFAHATVMAVTAFRCGRARPPAGRGWPRCHRRSPYCAGSGEAVSGAGIGRGTHRLAPWDDSSRSQIHIRQMMARHYLTSLFFSNRIKRVQATQPTNDRSGHPCQVAIEGSNRYSKPLRSFRLRVSQAQHVVQPSQSPPVELLGPSAQLSPGANLRPTVALGSCSPTPPAHLGGGDRLSPHTPQLSRGRNGCQVISLRHLTSDKGDYVN